MDTLGLLLKAWVHPANLSDKAGAFRLFLGLGLSPGEVFPRRIKVWADKAYGGLTEWLQRWLDWELEVVLRPPASKGFVLLPRRWVVERTFAWLGRNRRLAKSYEGLLETEASFLYVGMVRLMLRRLDKAA